MKYLTNSRHKSFAVNLLSYAGAFRLNDGWYKLAPFSLKGFFQFFGRNKSRDLICIYKFDKYDGKICKPIILKNFAVKALEDRPPLFFGAIK